MNEPIVQGHEGHSMVPLALSLYRWTLFCLDCGKRVYFFDNAWQAARLELKRRGQERRIAPTREEHRIGDDFEIEL